MLFARIADAAIPADCTAPRDDYIECLHHRKEADRRRLIADQLKKREKEQKEAEALAKKQKKEKGAS